MTYKTVHIVNCKSAAIRLAPWNPRKDKEIIGIRDGPAEKEGIVKAGSKIDIDPNNICYNWQGRKFYKVRLPDGWIYEGVIDYVGDDDG